MGTTVYSTSPETTSHGRNSPRPPFRAGTSCPFLLTSPAPGPSLAGAFVLSLGTCGPVVGTFTKVLWAAEGRLIHLCRQIGHFERLWDDRAPLIFLTPTRHSVGSLETLKDVVLGLSSSFQSFSGWGNGRLLLGPVTIPNSFLSSSLILPGKISCSFIFVSVTLCPSFCCRLSHCAISTEVSRLP